jgi:DNA-binding PadR family transcriptional regulator
MTSSYAFGGFGDAFRAMAERGHRPHGGHHRHRGPRADFPFGPGFPFGGPPFRNRKARRGDVRAAALVLLNEEPRNGYELMQEIEERSEGGWRPSPGSIYPALQQLEDEGLVRVREGEGRKLYELTDEGKAYIKEHGEELGTPWEAFTQDVGDEMRQLGGLIKDVAIAASQVLRAGDEAQIEQARKVLADAKRALYLILAGDEPAADA